MYQHILVPVDDSALSITTVGQAVALARRLDARITFFHARPDFSATSDGAVLHAMSPSGFDEKAPGNALAVLARAESEARMAKLAFTSIARTTDRPYEGILDVASEQGCDLIFMASHGTRGLKGLLMGSQTRKVLEHARIPVLVASTESNVVSPEMETALAIVQGEHRSMGAVMHGLRHLLADARISGEPIDADLLRSIVFYFKNFTEALHHPKEDAYLFDRLKARSSDAHEVLAVLHTQHAEEGGFIKALDAAVDAYVAAPAAERLEALAEAADRYAERLWEHMSLEEKFVLPACRQHLKSADWAEIASAFQSNSDPRFDEGRKEGFDKLFLRLVSQTK